MNDYTTAFHIYGILSAIYAPTIPLLWRYWLRQSSDLNTAGYKLAAYSHLFTWTPFLFTYAMHLLFQANFSLSWCNWALQVSLPGPWLFQVYAIYVMAYTGLRKLSTTQWLGFFTYLVWNVGQMVLQLIYVPRVNSYTRDYKPNGGSSSSLFRDPTDDGVDAPDMNDMSYLDEMQEEAGPWPSSDERDAIKAQMQEDIDNDPKPESAGEYNVAL